MLGPTHSLIALTGAVVLASQTTTDITQAGILIGASVATAKLPDVDCKLPIRHRGPATHSLIACLVFTLAVAVGVTAAGFPQYTLLIAAGVGLGVVLHVLADAMTISGVPALWPAAANDVHLLPRGYRFYTGTPERTKSWPKHCKRCHKLARFCRCGKAERVFSFLLLAGLLGFLWVTYGA